MATVKSLGRVAEDIMVNALNTIRLENSVGSQQVNLFLKTEVLSPRGSLSVAEKTRSMPTPVETVHVFADLKPLANWAHPVRHLFYSPENGHLVHSEYDHFPPNDFETDPKAYQPMHIPQVHFEAPRSVAEPEVGKQFHLPRAFSPRVLNAAGKRYAILFSGNSNNRHLNDLEFLYRVLLDDYGFDPDNITVMNYDGTLNYSGSPQPVGNWPGDNTPYRLKGHINGRGDRKAFESALEGVAGKLKPQDLLLIHTNNHGGEDGMYSEPWLCGYPNYSLVFKASEFGRQFKSFPKFASLIVSMEQCYSGGFMSPTVNNSPAAVTSFASAVPGNMSSMGGPDFDPWARDWIAAFHGSYPDGSPLKLPVPTDVSSKAAFDYSNAEHVPGDSPVYQDKPAGQGSDQYIDGRVGAEAAA